MYVFSCLYCGLNWQVCADGHLCVAFGVERAVERQISWPSTRVAVGLSDGCGTAVSRDLAGLPVSDLAFVSAYGTRPAVSSKGGLTNADER